MLCLSPMSEEDFQAYLSDALPDYAKEHVRAGHWHADEAEQRARKQFQHLLPDGLSTENMHLFSLIDEALGVKVGMIWFGMQRERAQAAAFIYDFIIYSAYRRRGYATQALQAMEEMVDELGAHRIELHVFAHNQPARALYEKLGYKNTSIWMGKEVGEKEGN